MKTSESLFEEMYSSKTVPDFRTLVYYLNRNPDTCAQTEEILFEMSIKFLKKKIKESKLKRLTLLS